MKEKIGFIFGDKGFWLPPVHGAEITAWIEHCDACAVSYRLNYFTRAKNPLMAMEYLAMDSPILRAKVP